MAEEEQEAAAPWLANKRLLIWLVMSPALVVAVIIIVVMSGAGRAPLTWDQIQKNCWREFGADGIDKVQQCEFTVLLKQQRKIDDAKQARAEQ